jgi:WD40 repeat protein
VSEWYRREVSVTRTDAWIETLVQTDPSRFISGSDDGSVRLWSINCHRSLRTLDLKSPVCSVQWSPTTSYLVACGSANYRVFLYDLRRVCPPHPAMNPALQGIARPAWEPGNSLDYGADPSKQSFVQWLRSFQAVFCTVDQILPMSLSSLLYSGLDPSKESSVQ